MGTPVFPEVSDDQVRVVFSAAAAGAGTARHVRPIAKAFGYHTFLVRTVEGKRYLLKIGREAAEMGRFQLGAENVARAIQGGVPAPRVIRIGQSDVIGGRAFLLQEYLEGQDGEEGFPMLSPIEKEIFSWDFGRAIGKLHSVEGPAFNEGVVKPEHAEDWFVNIAVRADKAAKDNRRTGVLGIDEIHTGVDHLKRLARKVKPHVEPKLVHRDLALRNTLIHEGRFRAVLDFEHARNSDPVFDFIRLALIIWREHPEMKDPFLDGYAETHPEKHALFQERFRLALGLELLGGLPYFARNELHAELQVYTEAYRAWLLECG